MQYYILSATVWPLMQGSQHQQALLLFGSLSKHCSIRSNNALMISFSLLHLGLKRAGLDRSKTKTPHSQLKDGRTKESP
jgi:hypothetical protein